ncbi:cupin [Rhizobium wenxiniae]|uniref:Quercetin dioxygenase-like cupin family protein n=1 Tax=Rhizobium wenxiniae TaxID=1737357 RepID=A0A7W9Y854_9HYPH|nr:cupin domain-containing protein [Rhizobium wenxiniae]MBB6163756.1 quercetin dioxygenase-like cupin family protein [Rhizobium wenxiniae]GGG18732.1 cupin [Rhizobium wenxiniae]
MSLPVFPVISPDKGVQRQVLSEAPELMVVSFRFEAGAEGKLHSHPHVQSTYVARGRFRFIRGNEAYELAAGDSLVIPSNVVHGCECMEEGELIDCFTPRREDFL